MSRYENGKIYKIVSVDYSKCYIGSTTESLKKRFERHRGKYKDYLKGEADNTRAYWLFDEFGVENCKIELIENYPCNSREELERKEGEYIRNTDCMNKIIAGRTRQERYKDENDYICFQKKIYRELHPEKRQEEGRRRYEKIKDRLFETRLCGCGKYFTVHHIRRHEKSQYHQNWLKQQEQEMEKI